MSTAAIERATRRYSMQWWLVKPILMRVWRVFDEDRRAFQLPTIAAHGGHVLAVAWSPIDSDLAFSGSERSIAAYVAAIGVQTERTADVGIARAKAQAQKDAQEKLKSRSAPLRVCIYQ
jgi:hypothetical protein